MASDIGKAFAMHFYQALCVVGGDPYATLDADTVYTSGYGTEDPWQDSVVGTKGIKLDKELAAFRSKQLQLFSIDTQQTVDDGLIVLVNGAAIGTESDPKPFAQTFFLGKDPEEGGYFIRNTILRFLNHSSLQPKKEQPQQQQPEQKQAAKKEKKAEPAPAKQQPESKQPTPVKQVPVEKSQHKKNAKKQSVKKQPPASFLDAARRPPVVKAKSNNSNGTNNASNNQAGPSKKKEVKRGNPVKENDKSHINSNAQCYVSNIPFNSSNQELSKALAQFGKVKSIIRPASKGYGFVEFARDGDAKKAIGFKGSLVLGGRELKIEPRTGQGVNGASKKRGPKRGNQKTR